MILEIFTVYDSKAEAHLPPFFLPSVAVATRVFSNAANDTEHAFGANPGDYTLFHIGSFDDECAEIEVRATARNLGIAQEFKRVVMSDEELDLLNPSEKEPWPHHAPKYKKINSDENETKEKS